MPYKVGAHPDCKGVAVMKADGTMVACHPDREAAMKHMAALYANVPDAKGDMKVYTEPMKAEPLEGGQLDAWLAGKRSRRILVVPFSGPLPGGKAGLDLDGEYFDEDTDLVGEFPALRKTRERLVDWHHDQDPTGKMKGAIIGRIVLDEEPEDDGVWADFWANAGEKRRSLLARLESQGVPLYGSSQSAGKAFVQVAPDGHILTWPLVRHTITTSPQNTHAVVPPLKALLGSGDYEALTIAALQAAMAAGTGGLLEGTAGQHQPASPSKARDAHIVLDRALDHLIQEQLDRLGL